MATAGKITPIAAMKPKTEPTRATQPTQIPLIFELSAEDRRGTDLGARTAGKSGAEILGSELCRTDLVGFPELSEPQVLRHFLRLSQTNFAQALQFYPLGSCTMKYNPVVNDEMAALEGFASIHPLTPAHLAQGAFELMARLEAALAEASRSAYQRQLQAAGLGEITTEIREAPPFYFAEDYHQQYLAKNPYGYCGLGGTGVSCPLPAKAAAD